MFTKAICLTIFVLAISIGSTDACVKRKNYFGDRSLSGKCCAGKSCMGCLPCRDDPLYKPTESKASATTVSTPSTPSAPAPAPPSTPAPAPVAAFDSNDLCPTWAAQGQCVANSAYMLTNCALSCEGQSEGQSSTAPAINPVVTTCDQKNVDYSSRQNCCRCERQDAAQPRWLRGARKLGLIGATVGATASVATAAADTTIAANGAYIKQLPCC